MTSSRIVVSSIFMLGALLLIAVVLLTLWAIGSNTEPINTAESTTTIQPATTLSSPTTTPTSSTLLIQTTQLTTNTITTATSTPPTTKIPFITSTSSNTTITNLPITNPSTTSTYEPPITTSTNSTSTSSTNTTTTSNTTRTTSAPNSTAATTITQQATTTTTQPTTTSASASSTTEPSTTTSTRATTTSTMSTSSTTISRTTATPDTQPVTTEVTTTTTNAPTSSTNTNPISTTTTINTDDIDLNTVYTLPSSIVCANTSNGKQCSIVLRAEGSILQVINDSKIVIVGTVGQIVAQDYHRIHQQDHSDLSHLSQSELDEWLHKERESYYQIEVHEVLRGNPELPFILRFPDLDHYNPFNYRPLVEGQQVLLFSDRVIGPSRFTDKLEFFYSTSVSGIFDIINNRAFPRNENVFRFGFDEDGYDIIDGEKRRYWDLAKLKVSIQISQPYPK